jgi:hypothetical protein
MRCCSLRKAGITTPHITTLGHYGHSIVPAGVATRHQRGGETGPQHPPWGEGDYTQLIFGLQGASK